MVAERCGGLSIRRRVASETRVLERDPFRTTETVKGLTPADRATSRKCRRFFSGMASSLCCSKIKRLKVNYRI
jgi:hypothetical protein